MHLILGGTGTLGRHLVARLRAEDRPVRVMTRDPARATDLAARGVEVAPGDLRDRAAVERACEGVTVAVAAAHSLFGRGRAASPHVDGAAHRSLIDVARAAGVGRLVYVSVHDHDGAYHAIPFFRIKHETEAYLRASGLAHVILRPTAFMETHAHLLIGSAVATGRMVMLPGRGAQPRNFVAADDVARVAMRAIDDASLGGETLLVAGPENLTSLEVVRLYERLTGRTARVRHVPLGVLGTVARLLRPIHPGVSQVMLTAILGDTTDQRADARALAQRLGYEPTPLEVVARGLLAAERSVA
jgi:uncharacterized protein YbjT (DUF2867 family)